MTTDNKRILCLCTDAFGGHGGIAKFNRDFLRAACTYPKCSEVIAFPRLIPHPIQEILPTKLQYMKHGINSKLRYIATVLVNTLRNRSYNLVVCGHINLLPVAWIVSMVTGAPLVLIIHGIDAWTPTRNTLINFLASKVHAFVAVSEFSKRRFVSWSKVDVKKGYILPNCVDLVTFSPKQKNPTLLERYHLSGKTVLMTLGRLVSQDRYKGFDEVLETLPRLAKDIPNVVYLINGDGEDRARLEQKARLLGVADRVIFSGLVSEAEKADHYNLADAFVMPSRGEGFGIVLLEAMACGVPAVGSKLDGSREALLDGQLGVLVDPGDHTDIRRGILEALQQPRRVPEGLKNFSVATYEQRVHRIIKHVIGDAL